jgi:hypothetical protein
VFIISMPVSRSGCIFGSLFAVPITGFSTGFLYRAAVKAGLAGASGWHRGLPATPFAADPVAFFRRPPRQRAAGLLAVTGPSPVVSLAARRVGAFADPSTAPAWGAQVFDRGPALVTSPATWNTSPLSRWWGDNFLSFR